MKRQKRLLVGAISYADAEPALKIARALLRGGIGNLAGMLVENSHDTDTLPHHARQVVTARGMVRGVPDRSSRRRLLESDARAFREGLRQIASAAKVASEFRLERGEPVSQLVKATRASDVLVIGYRRIASLPGPVVVILPAAGDADPMRQVSQILAAALHSHVLELAPARPDDGLMARISRTCASALVVDGSDWSTDQLRKLVESARCPVLVLGAQDQQDTEG